MSAQGDPGRGQAGPAGEGAPGNGTAAVTIPEDGTAAGTMADGQVASDSSGWQTSRVARGYPGRPGFLDLSRSWAGREMVIQHDTRGGRASSDPRTARPAAGGDRDRDPRGGSGGPRNSWRRSPGSRHSVWEQAASAWSDSGLAWQQPAGWAPAVLDRQHTQPIPVVRDDAAGPAVDAEGPAAGPNAAGSPDGPPDRREPGQPSRPVTTQDRASGGPAGPDRPAPPQVADRGAVPARRGRGWRRPLLAGGAAIAVLAAGVIVVAGLHSTGSEPADTGLLLAPPTAGTATQALATGPASGPAGALPTLTGAVGTGQTMVVFGAVPAVPGPRPLFLVSADGGQAWSAGTVRGNAPAGATPVLAAGGQGRWLAVGSGAGWISADGRNWSATPGIAPMIEGDRVLALTRTTGGFLAAGENVAVAGGLSARSPVLWTSPDGVSWQRQAAPHLPAGHNRVGAIRWVAAQGGVIVMGGDVVRTRTRQHGHHKLTSVTYRPGIWRSLDGGARWLAVHLPAGHGAGPYLAGIAAGSGEFVAVRPGRTGRGHADAVVYVSPRAGTWRFAGKLTTPGAGLRVGAVVGSSNGVAVTGTSGVHRLVFVAADGRHWHRAADLAPLADVLTGVVPGPAGTILAAGTGHTPASAPATPQRPALLLGRATWAPVAQTVLAAQSRPYTVVRDVAAGGGLHVAVGSVDGTPAIWAQAAAGRWVREADVPVPAAGAVGLTGVVDGSAGWLVVGGQDAAGGQSPGPLDEATSVGPPQNASLPQVMTSADGRSWHPVGLASTFATPGVTLAGAAAGQGGYVVVGERIRAGRALAALWWSADLGDWTSVRWLSGPAPASSSQVRAVAAAGGGFVAAGAIGTHPAVWVSMDGQNWTATVLPLPTGVARGVLTKVSVTGGTAVAVGTQVAQSGQGWRDTAFAAVSTDGGRTWRESAIPSDGRAASVAALTAIPGGFLAGGVQGPPASRAATFWTSPDGLRWTRVPPAGRPPGAAASQVTAVSAVGREATGWGYQVTGAAQRLVLWEMRVR